MVLRIREQAIPKCDGLLCLVLEWICKELRNKEFATVVFRQPVSKGFQDTDWGPDLKISLTLLIGVSRVAPLVRISDERPQAFASALRG